MRSVPFALPENALAKRLDALRFTFRKWDLHVRGRGTVASGAIVLSREEHETLVAASEALWARAAALGQPEGLGVPDGLRRLLGGRGARVTRLDWFLTDDGWRVSEMNDDVPGGYNDALGLPALFADAADEKGLVVEGDLPDALTRALPGQRVGFVYATAYAEDLQVVRLLADLVEAEGREVVLASPAHLDADGTLAGERVDSLYRFFPSEWFPLLPNVDAWEAAVRRGTPIVSPFEAAWTQSKLLFTLLDDPHVPETRPFDADSRALAESRQEDWVLKPAFGRMGEGVVLGADVSRAAWRDALASAAHRGRPYALQRRFVPRPLEVAPGVTRTPCIGVYLVDGLFAGYYARTSERRVVAYDAANVLALVESV